MGSVKIFYRNKKRLYPDMKRLLVAVTFFLVSCTDESIPSRISDADKIEIIDDATKFSLIETREEVVQEFKKTFDNPGDAVDCPTQGTILFKKGDKTRLQVRYYKDATACNFLTIDENGKKTGYRYSFNILAYLGQYFQKLKQAHNARHN